jgi:hypothetical protein
LGERLSIEVTLDGDEATIAVEQLLAITATERFFTEHP